MTFDTADERSAEGLIAEELLPVDAGTDPQEVVHLR